MSDAASPENPPPAARDDLTLDRLADEVVACLGTAFAVPIPALFGASDGKAISTFVEVRVHEHLTARYADYEPGNAARGVDFPGLDADLKCTSVRQPQSSAPYASVEELFYGLPHHLVVVVYEKVDDTALQAARMQLVEVVQIDRSATADYATTLALQSFVRHGDAERLVDGFLAVLEPGMPDEARRALGARLIADPPALGRLGLCAARQWRVQYGHALGGVDDVRVRSLVRDGLRMADGREALEAADGLAVGGSGAPAAAPRKRGRKWRPGPDQLALFA